MVDRRAIGAYARALFDLAEEQDALDALYGEMNFLGELCRSHSDWLAFVHQLSLPASRREAALRELFEGRVHGLTLRLLMILSDARELSLLPDVALRFGRLYRKSRGIVSVKVMTAAPLDGDAEAALRRRLLARFGERTEMSVQVDSSLVGGLRVHVGNTIYDYSLAGQMEGLKRALVCA